MLLRRRRRQPSGGLTGRALVLGAVVVLLALILASPLQRYLQGRQSLSQSEQRFGASTQRVKQLEALEQQWHDPAYIEAQARARLQLAQPGDTVYVVVDPSQDSGDASSKQNPPITASNGQGSWRDKAWTSLQVADAAP